MAHESHQWGIGTLSLPLMEIKIISLNGKIISPLTKQKSVGKQK